MLHIKLMKEMVSKMNFVTLFNMENVHITKDVGLIPYGMHRYYQYDSYCASYDNGPYTAIDRQCHGMKMWYVKKRTGNFDIDSLFFLMKHSKKIDILNIYHIRLASALKIFIYKMINPKGKVYWKMDGCVGTYKNSNVVKKIICGKAMQRCSLLSAELEENKKMLENDWVATHMFWAHIRNPYQPERNMIFKEYKDRENTILTVGRLGTRQKATEVLLNAFKLAVHKYGLKGWNLKLIGSIEKKETDFEMYINKWYEENADMKPLVSFLGMIHDKEEMYNNYHMAKVFAFPSRWESYAMPPIEAAISGCFIIATNIPSNREMTEQFQYAASFPVDDVEDMAGQLAKWCADEAGMEENAKKLYECIKQKNSLYKICSVINDEIA